MEQNALTGMSTVGVNSTVAQVVATDRDDPSAQLHFSITAGNELGIFDIPTPSVSHPPYLNCTLVHSCTVRQCDIGSNSNIFFALQSGTVTVLQPDLIDYETNTQFDLVITASDLVVPENERRTVSGVCECERNVLSIK